MVAAAKRKTPTTTNGGLRDGTNYLALVDAEVEWLASVSCGWLTNIAGTGDAITATSDTSVVAAITAYSRAMTWFYVPTAANTTAATINIDGLGAKAIKDKFGAALQGAELAIGGCYPLVFDGTNFRAVTVTAGSASALVTAPDIIAQDQKSSGTAGGTFTSGSFQTRTLNTLVRNANSIASLSGSRVVLPAGSYYIEWSAPGWVCNQHQTRLFNATDSSLIAYGQGAYSNSGATYASSYSRGSAFVTIATPKSIGIDHRCNSTRATDGFGLAMGFSTTEIYAELKAWRQ